MIKLFTSSKMPNCPGCLAAKKYLASTFIRFEEVDIAKNRAEANIMFKKSKSLMIPQIQIGKEIVIGFNARKVAETIGKIIEESSQEA